jgi:large subunit ribosomal protein L34e
MTYGKYKSGRFRKVFVRTPGARNVIHYEERKINAPSCAICKEPLKGVPRLIGSKFKNLPKSMKKTERPYGGHLCTKCARIKIKAYARSL